MSWYEKQETTLIAICLYRDIYVIMKSSEIFARDLRITSQEAQHRDLRSFIEGHSHLLTCTPPGVLLERTRTCFSAFQAWVLTKENQKSIFSYRFECYIVRSLHPSIVG